MCRIGISKQSTQGNEMSDKLTKEVASDLIKMFDVATKNEDLPEMDRIVNIVCSSPNNPFKREILRQLGV